MTLNQREDPQARAELRAAANWYDDPATGQELLDASLEARRSIAAMPNAWPKVADWDREPVVRRKRFTGFPYGVIYYVSGNEVVIVAYAHERRRPGYWKDRITN
ncbi:MAG: type II toxin-antitoxin system RelE/ParE family toxin [Micrococcales bacterium]|nr:type II toxin-antitoxin system RelE/ParE family toxin [Micrococcales bacterium]MCL2667925.1 type II toxin-antitoxin system RelE/ParE family toxin [Micrococcales bacterium]